MLKDAIVTVMVSDMNRAHEFYCAFLGCTPVNRYGDEWAEVRAPNVRVGLHPGGKKPFAEHSRHMQLGLRVDDLDAACTLLEGRGIKFTRHAERGMRRADFVDPDGNPLYFMELKWG
jgi:catechol 2,3-dioxygenase-like lactoylglutathione lyase family enzyme